MGARNHYQASILTIHWLHSCPGTDDTICWAKGEVMEILVHWVARCFLPFIKIETFENCKCKFYSTLSTDVVFCDVENAEKLTTNFFSFVCTKQFITNAHTFFSEPVFLFYHMHMCTCDYILHKHTYTYTYLPASGGLLISMVCIAITLGPIKLSTYFTICSNQK